MPRFAIFRCAAPVCSQKFVQGREKDDFFEDLENLRQKQMELSKLHTSMDFSLFKQAMETDDDLPPTERYARTQEHLARQKAHVNNIVTKLDSLTQEFADFHTKHQPPLPNPFATPQRTNTTTTPTNLSSSSVAAPTASDPDDDALQLPQTEPPPPLPLPVVPAVEEPEPKQEEVPPSPPPPTQQQQEGKKPAGAAKASRWSYWNFGVSQATAAQGSDKKKGKETVK
ncbi:hypothetical protein BJ742DRAFT_293055 [Cladochytrium replicatum]|nr:hypothetical protein BJ742DRAFT_293055 [Cladochytrium replicatum]